MPPPACASLQTVVGGNDDIGLSRFSRERPLGGDDAVRFCLVYIPPQHTAGRFAVASAQATTTMYLRQRLKWPRRAEGFRRRRHGHLPKLASRNLCRRAAIIAGCVSASSRSRAIRVGKNNPAQRAAVNSRTPGSESPRRREKRQGQLRGRCSRRQKGMRPAHLR